MGDENRFKLEGIVDQNRRRINCQMYQLGIYDSYLYRNERTCNNITSTNHLDQGILSTYFNFTIRKRIFELLQLQSNNQPNEMKVLQGTSINSTNTYCNNSVSLWEDLENNLSVNQCKWVYLSIYLNLPLKEIAEQEGVTIETVINWGREFKKSLDRIIRDK